MSLLQCLTQSFTLLCRFLKFWKFASYECVLFVFSYKYETENMILYDHCNFQLYKISRVRTKSAENFYIHSSTNPNLKRNTRYLINITFWVNMIPNIFTVPRRIIKEQ